MEHPKEIGDRSMLAAMLGLKAAGYTLVVPFGENTRYDLVIDDGKALARVQCKTGRLRDGAIVFAVTSTYGHHRNPATARGALTTARSTSSLCTALRRPVSISSRSPTSQRARSQDSA
jgi:PD-(D/E)XK endonuclease